MTRRTQFSAKVSHCLRPTPSLVSTGVQRPDKGRKVGQAHGQAIGVFPVVYVIPAMFILMFARPHYSTIVAHLEKMQNKSTHKMQPEKQKQS